jgi:diacylglycerol kinase (ATP)
MISRLVNALKFSFQGLGAALKNETAFLQEFIVLILAVIAAFVLTQSMIERLVLIASWVLVMIVELLNSSIECLADEITQDRRPRIKKAKDYGSAAVLLSIIIASSAWAVILLPSL